MKKTIFKYTLILLVFGVAANFSKVNAKSSSISVSASDLAGTWVLNAIDANDIIEISVNKSNSESIDNTGAQKTKSQKMSIPLKKILQNELSIGNTKFVFSNGAFDFYRKSNLTFSGNWLLNADELTLKYNSGNFENIKNNKILKLTDKILMMESESYGKKVVFTFIKK